MRHATVKGLQIAVTAMFALGLAACGSGVQFVQEDMTKYPPKDDDAKIEIHQGGTMQPHTVLGTLTASKVMKASFNDESTYDQVMDELTKYARKVGADALINVHPVSSEDTRVIISGTAVRFFEQKRSVTSN